MDAARGDYVFFSDDDDTLGPEALQRLTDFAIAHDSDVVIPRTVGRNRGVPSITRTVVDAQDDPALIMSSLAPQKLFSRAFLQRSGVRFAEGHFRLEDHLFVVTAYLRARRVSTYADYPCYYLTYQGGRAHISQQQPDWHAYFASVRACLDRVDEEGGSPETRRVMRSRWMRAEALSRVRGDAYPKLATPQLIDEVRRLLIDRYTAAELAALKPLDRVLANLLVDGRDDDVAAFAAWESSILVSSAATRATVHRDGTVRVALQSSLAIAGTLPDLTDTSGRYPSEGELLQQVASYTGVGVEVQHARTKVRRALQVTHGAGGRTTAVLARGEEPLAAGKWTVVALAGEHRSRRRRPVDQAERLRIAPSPVRVHLQTLGFAGAGQLVLTVQKYVAPAGGPLTTRVLRRLRRVLARQMQAPLLRHNHG
jgi:hypothetical protein